jgi:mannitol/fructose-specific phosphotransferase system IIA component (Ntr-type)
MVFPIAEFVRDDQFLPGLRSSNKFEVLEALVERLRDIHLIPLTAVSRVLDAVFRAEREKASGLPGGVAAPHVQLELLPASALIIGLAPEGVDFGAPDGSVSRIIILSLEGKGEPPSQCRSEILEVLRQEPELVEILSESPAGGMARMMLGAALVEASL